MRTLLLRALGVALLGLLLGMAVRHSSGLALGRSAGAQEDGASAAPAPAADPIAGARAVEERLAALIARVRPAVVTVSHRAVSAVPEQATDGDAPGEAPPPPAPREGGRKSSPPGPGPDPADPRYNVTGGSGVIVSSAGIVLTNDHVVQEQTELVIGLPGGREVIGRVLGRDRTGDVAAIDLPGDDGWPCVPLGDSDALRQGEWVLALGNPWGLGVDHEPAATLGVVSGLHRYLGGRKVYGDAIQVDAEINPGNSGGPLFNLAGELVGLNGRISVRDGERVNVGVGFAVPINQVKLVLDDLVAGRDVEHGFLGVRFRVDGAAGEGVAIEEVIPGTPAALAGLRAGDRILSVDGRAVQRATQFQSYMSVLTAGVEVRLVVRSGEGDGEAREMRVRLGPRPRGGSR